MSIEVIEELPDIRVGEDRERHVWCSWGLLE